MAFIPFNPNPQGKMVGDCVVRAVAKATDQPWSNTYTALTMQGYLKGDLPNANYVWGSYLKSQGFKKGIIPDSCPDCYTVGDFANDHPHGTYVLALGDHAVCVRDGDVYDSWDSSLGVPLYYWQKED